MGKMSLYVRPLSQERCSVLSELQRFVDGFKNPVVFVISLLSGLIVDQAKRCQDIGLQASFQVYRGVTR